MNQVLAEIESLLALDASPGRAGLERWAAAIREALKAEEARWLSEERALRRCGKTLEWLRARRAGWTADGYARRVAGKWQYHEAAVPRRKVAPQAADDPKEQARRDAAA